MRLKTFKIFEKRNSFISEVYDIIDNIYNGRNITVPGYDKMVDTKYGPLYINVREDFGNSTFAIFMRFAFPEEIKGKIKEANQHSGKWNIWASDKDEALEELNKRLKEVEGTSNFDIGDNDIKNDGDDLPF